MMLVISLRPSERCPVTAAMVTRPERSQPGVGDERFGAVDHPLVAVKVARVVGAGVDATRLGEPERAQLLAGGQGPQPPVVLGGGAVAPRRHGPEADGGLQGDRDQGVDPGQLLDRQAQGGVVGAHAADLLGERQPEQAHAGHLVEHHRVERRGDPHRLLEATTSSAKARTILRNSSCFG